MPKSINDVKLINAGKVLENGKTLSESRVMMGEIPGGVITMHVVLRPSSEAKTGEALPRSDCHHSSARADQF